MSKKSHLLLFTLICLVLGIISAMQIWQQRLLYTNSVVRLQVENVIHTLSMDEGIFKSGLSIQQLTPDFVVLHYRHYARGADNKECKKVYFEPYTVEPCDV